MIAIKESKPIYIPFDHINTQDLSFCFRTQLDTHAGLENSLKKSGQTYPMLLEELSSSQYRVLDGHKRIQALKKIKENGGAWEKVWAYIVDYQGLNSLDRLKNILERLQHHSSTYGCVEKGRIFKKFHEEGLAIGNIAALWNISVHDTEDTLELAKTHPLIADQLNTSSLPPQLAVMLVRRFENWLKFSTEKTALAISKRLLDHANRETVNLKSWRFLLDFYWDTDRPFLNGHIKNN
jgi:hypothetical protein